MHWRIIEALNTRSQGFSFVCVSSDEAADDNGTEGRQKSSVRWRNPKWQSINPNLPSTLFIFFPHNERAFLDVFSRLFCWRMCEINPLDLGGKKKKLALTWQTAPDMKNQDWDSKIITAQTDATLWNDFASFLSTSFVTVLSPPLPSFCLLLSPTSPILFYFLSHSLALTPLFSLWHPTSLSVSSPPRRLPGGLAAEHHHHRQLHEQVQPPVFLPAAAQTHGVEPPWGLVPP